MTTGVPSTATPSSNPLSGLASLLKLAAASQGQNGSVPSTAPPELTRLVHEILRALLAEGERGDAARAAGRALLKAGLELLAIARTSESAK